MDYRMLMIKAVVLDFDGTMCRLFENYDLHDLKSKLQAELLKYNISLDGFDDCFDAFRLADRQLPSRHQRQAALSDINRIVMNAECKAVNTGVDIDGLPLFIDLCKERGIELGIATNNSKECIEIFLESRGMAREIPIIGRDIYHLERMKPDPWTLNRVMEILGVNRENVLFLGDHPTDYQCAVAAGVHFIGLAATARKKKRFQQKQSAVRLKENYYEMIEYLSL